MMVAPTPYFTDCGRHVRIYEEARSLMHRGHTVQIATRHLGRDMAGVSACRTPQLSWLRDSSLSPSWHDFYLDLLLYSRALKLARSFRPHLIHAHLHEGAWIGARLKKKLGIPLLFDFQGSMSGEMVDQGFVREGSLLHRFFLKQEGRINHGPADFIVARSTPLARDLVERWGVSRERIRPLPDGVDTSLFRPYRRDEVRARLRLPATVPLVVYLGTLDRNQGIDTLLSAIVQLKAKGSPMRFLIMGFPEEEYRARAGELGIERMIVFTGRIEYAKAPLYLSAGDCAVSSTCSPMQSNAKLLAYMACGLPTVAFDTPVNRELLGDAGVYARYDDAADLAARLAALMKSADERARLGLMARERAVQRHSWDLRGEALDEIYRLRLRR
jgi:glycosyltransferase involved in cell wall biosynthesis